jgi:hypothetical protein
VVILSSFGTTTVGMLSSGTVVVILSFFGTTPVRYQKKIELPQRYQDKANLL